MIIWRRVKSGGCPVLRFNRTKMFGDILVDKPIARCRVHELRPLASLRFFGGVLCWAFRWLIGRDLAERFLELFLVFVATEGASGFDKAIKPSFVVAAMFLVS
jgi:hypothetical protein